MRITSILILAIALGLLAGGASADNKYVGAKKCGMCHKAKDKGEAYVLWEKSAHAGAYKTLETDAAKKIAKDKGLANAPAEAPECLKCHVTGGGVAKNVDASFKKEEGVTCEACHGAASGYMMVHSKPENKEKAVAAGLIAGSTDGKACETCHNAESPTFKGFTYAEWWAKIAHKMPAKK